MEYTVQVCLEGDRVRMRVSEIWKWVDHRKIEPPVFRYRMTAAAVVLRLDFNRLSDATTFRKDFAAVLELNADADRTERPLAPAEQQRVEHSPG